MVFRGTAFLGLSSFYIIINMVEDTAAFNRIVFSVLRVFHDLDIFYLECIL